MHLPVVKTKELSVSFIAKILTATCLIGLTSCSPVKDESAPKTQKSAQQQTASVKVPHPQKTVIHAKEIISINLDDEWQYKKGKTAPNKNWNTLNYTDDTWLKGKAGFGYGDGDDATVIDDMINNYPTVYARKKFTYNGEFPINTMLLNIYYDDGFIAYINGQEVIRVNMPTGHTTHLSTAKNSHEASQIASFDLSEHKHLINLNDNIFAIEIHNSSVSSSDLSLNPSLIFNKDATPFKKQKTITVASPKLKQKKRVKKNPFCHNKKSCGTLGNYRLVKAFEKLDYIPDDLSGITYVADSNSFFLIDNGLGYIVEVDTSYKLIRKIKTIGFGDSEDIVHLGSNNEFAIVNEDSTLFIGTISADTTTLNSEDFQKIIFDTYKGNEGAEGVAFDISTQTFFIVKEEHPRKLYSFIRPAHKNNVTVTPSFPFDIQTIPQPRLTQDLSAITFNPSTGRLLLLSDIDYRVVDIDLNGTVYGVLQLPKWKQPEGIALDNYKNLHIVGEPNNHTLYSNSN